jgi:heme-binding protein
MSAGVKRMLWAVVVILVVIQVYRPAKTNPGIDPKNEVSASLTVPRGVANILERSCNDCHSNRTVWPWYSNVAPISWLVAFDAKRGRKELNLSEWGAQSPKRKLRKLDEICNEVKEKEMPGFIYPITHPTAKLTDADIQTVCSWTQTARQEGAADAPPARP